MRLLIRHRGSIFLSLFLLSSFVLGFWDTYIMISHIWGSHAWFITWFSQFVSVWPFIGLIYFNVYPMFYQTKCLICIYIVYFLYCILCQLFFCFNYLHNYLGFASRIIHSKGSDLRAGYFQAAKIFWSMSHCWIKFSISWGTKWSQVILSSTFLRSL